MWNYLLNYLFNYVIHENVQFKMELLHNKEKEFSPKTELWNFLLSLSFAELYMIGTKLGPNVLI